MPKEAVTSRLGRGLASLIGEAEDDSRTPERARPARRAPIELLRPNPRNPRRAFAADELESLAASIRERGVIQPIVVRAQHPLEGFEIIAGERRWRAAQQAGQHDVPIVVVEADDREALELAIVENVQRTDLNAIEEAQGYRALADEFGHAQDEIAKAVGKSRSHVANMLRLLRLPQAVQAHLAEGKLTAGHGRALLALPDPEAAAQLMIEKQLSVRQAEALAQETADRPPRPRVAGAAIPKDADTLALERRLNDQLGLAVAIHHAGVGGELRIRYRSLEQLDEVVRRLGAA